MLSLPQSPQTLQKWRQSKKQHLKPKSINIQRSSFEYEPLLWECNGNVRKIVQHIGAKAPRSQDGCFLAMLWSHKGWWLGTWGKGAWGAEQGRMRQSQIENRGSSCHTAQAKFSSSGLPLSSLFNRDWEQCYPIFMGTFSVRQPDTSLPPSAAHCISTQVPGRMWGQKKN